MNHNQLDVLIFRVFGLNTVTHQANIWKKPFVIISSEKCLAYLGFIEMLCD